MAELKTKPNDRDVNAFLAAVEDPKRRADAQRLLALMAEATGERPVMWGDSMVGFGSYRYRTSSGWSGEWLATGFSPRKANLTVYVMTGFDGFEALLARLGKFKTAKSCLYLKRLDDVDETALRTLIAESVARLTQG